MGGLVTRLKTRKQPDRRMISVSHSNPIAEIKVATSHQSFLTQSKTMKSRNCGIAFVSDAADR